MKRMLKNSKGFTLVELLAVIVVLAVIILIAMPSVMSAMDKARRNALITEANEIAKVAQTAYADKSMSMTTPDTCYSLEKLVDEGYLDKNLNGYTGSVQIIVGETGKITTKIWLSNGMYKIVTKDQVGAKIDGADPNDITIDNIATATDGTSNNCGA